MAWKADSILGVWFSPPVASAFDANQLWLALIGASPSSFNKLSAVGPFAASHAAGPVSGYNLTIAAQPGRVDLQVTRSSNPLGPPEPIDQIDEALTVLESLLSKAVQKFPATRLAVVLNLSEPVNSIWEASKRAGELAGNFAPPSESIDVSIQLNVQIPSQIQDVAINRLCRWSSATQQMLKFQMAEGTMQDSPLVVEERFAIVHQIDVNTVPGPTQISSEDALVLLNGLAQEARALLSQGYARLEHNAG